MKRFAWLLLIAILSFSTVGFSLPAPPPLPASFPAAVPPVMPAPAPSGASIPGYNIVCDTIRATLLCVSVSQPKVIPGSFVTVYGLMKHKGTPVKGKLMRVVWHSRTSTSCIGITDETGLASCTTYVPTRMARGYSVKVWVYLDHFKLNTQFRTKDITQDPRQED